jgi:hypothetical protein
MSLAASTKMAIDWMLKHQTPEYFSAWLKKRTEEDRQQIVKYISEKK